MSLRLCKITVQRLQACADAIAANPDVIVWNPKGTRKLVWAANIHAPEQTIFTAERGLQFIAMNSAARERLAKEVKLARARRKKAKGAAA